MKNLILIIFCLFGVVIINAQCVDNGNYWNKSWVSCQTSPNPNMAHGNSLWFMYEFHEPQTIDSSYIWNANRTGETTMGINEVIIEYTTDTSNNWNLLGTYNFPQADGTDTYGGFLGPIFDGLSLQKILFTVVSTHETPMNCASLAEIQFQTVCTKVWYADNDGDGLGNSDNTIIDCTAPEGYVYNNVDTCDAIVWADVYTIFDNSNCTDCHGGSGGLDLSNYASFLEGGNSNCDLTVGTTFVDIIETGLTCNGNSIGPMIDRPNVSISAKEIEKIQAWINGGTLEYCEDDICTQTINLEPGWNLISLDVSPDDKSLSNVLNSLQPGNLEFVTGFDNGAIVFDVNAPFFLNSLSEVTDGFGYWVRVGQADVLTVSGTCIADNYRKPYDAGWNLVAYPKDESETPAVYFGGLITDANLQFVTGFDNGAKVFDPMAPSFLNSLQSLENGFGYWVRVNTAISGKTGGDINQSNVFNFINGETNLPDGETISIQTRAGEILGELEVNHNGYLMTTAVYGDDLTTEVVEGISVRTPLVFVWNNQVIDLGTSFRGDLSVEKVVLIFDEKEILVSQNSGIKVYPNPTNSIITFEFRLLVDGDVLVQLFNTEGKLVNVEQVKDLKSGLQSFTYSMYSLNDGIYSYKIVSPNETFIGRFTKVE